MSSSGAETTQRPQAAGRPSSAPLEVAVDQPPVPPAPPGYSTLLDQRATFAAAFRYALNGVLRTLCTQRNMKIHWVSGLAVMLVGMALNLDIASRASVIFCVFVVLCMEVLNTALEAFVDLHVKHYARTAMVAKDAAAAAVLILAIGAVVVFADVLLHSWSMVKASGEAIIRTVTFGVPLLAVVGAMLWSARSPIRIAILTGVAVALVSVLAWYSRDEVFSLGALAFTIGAPYARAKEPKLLGDGPAAPRPPTHT